MNWLFTIETEPDLIVICRLMNIFRRKGVKLFTLALASAPEGYNLMAEVEIRESEADHHFHFLRRTDGVKHVAYYRPDGSNAAFALVDGEAGAPGMQQWSEGLPGSRAIFVSHGRTLFEIPAFRPAQDAAGVRFLPFTCVRSTRSTAEATPPAAAR